MALTPEQLTTLAADIAADPTLSLIPQTSDGAFEVATAYTLDASPDFTVWRTNILSSECQTAMVWTEFIAIGAGERDAWQFMLSTGEINGADTNIRQGIQDIFAGAGGAGTRAALVAIAKRLATRAEALFATGTGSVASPGTMVVEGSLSYQDVLNAWAS